MTNANEGAANVAIGRFGAFLAGVRVQNGAPVSEMCAIEFQGPPVDSPMDGLPIKRR